MAEWSRNQTSFHIAWKIFHGMLVHRYNFLVVKNRRENERVPFQTSASLHFADDVHENLDIRNLSMKGAFVAGVSGMKVADQCKVELCLSGTSSSLCLKMLAEVVRVADEGAGLYFVELDPDTFFHLKNTPRRDPEKPANILYFVDLQSQKPE